MFVNKLVPLLALVALVVDLGSAATDIKQMVINDDLQIISTSGSNYALSGRQLVAAGVEAVSVTNGNNFVVYGPGCDVSVASLGNLPEDTRTLIDDLKMKFDNSVMNPQRNHLSSFTFRGDTVLSENAQLTTYSTDGYLVHQAERGKNSFSVSKEDLPNNLERIFVTDRVTTLVFKDGMVQMKPNACLQPDVQQLLAPIMLSMQRAEIFRQLLRDSEQKLNRQVDDARNRLDERATRLDRQLDTGLRNVHDKIDQRHSTTQNTLTNGFKNVHDKVDQRHSTLQSTVSLGFKDVREHSDQHHSTAQNTLTTGFKNVHDKIDQRHATLQSIVSLGFKDVREHSDQHHSTAQNTMTAGFKNVQDKLDQRHSTLQTIVSNGFKDVYDKADERHTKMHSTLTSGFKDVHDKADERHKKVQSTLTSGFKEVHDKADQRHSQVRTAINDMKEKILDSMMSKFDATNKMVASLNDEMKKVTSVLTLLQQKLPK